MGPTERSTKRYLTFAYEALSYMVFKHSVSRHGSLPWQFVLAVVAPRRRLCSSARSVVVAEVSKDGMSACRHLGFLYRQSGEAPFEHAFA
jgi:hypothetical protein